MRIDNVVCDDFAIGAYIPFCFHSHFEWYEPTRCDVGFYGGKGIDNMWVNCVASSTPANGVAFWVLGEASSTVLVSDTKDFSAGAGAWQWMVGNDTSVTVPTNASTYISQSRSGRPGVPFMK